MTRGYVTIATGGKQYYKIAANLLLSYRLNTKERLPFAIIAEEENEYTDLFDMVIITEKAHRSFLDKFLLLKLCPFDETIYFDSDSLAYGDLNEYWNVFGEWSTDFSAIGVNVGLNEEGAWYHVEDVWEYGKKISYKTRVHSGVCYIRKSVSLDKLYNDCYDILNNYDKLYFYVFPGVPTDEAIFGLAMPLNNMKAETEISRMIGALPCLIKIEANMLKRKLSYCTSWGEETKNNGLLIHFGNVHTYEPLYKYEAACVNYMSKYKNKKPPILSKIYYEYGIIKIFINISYRIYKLKKFVKRVADKIKSLIAK